MAAQRSSWPWRSRAQPASRCNGRSLSEAEIAVNASVGISIYPDDAADADSLLKHSDIAMYLAKEHGRNDHAVYVSDGRDYRRQLTLASRLGAAISNGELVLHYQPLVDLRNGTVVGAEALVRWQDGERGLIPPGDFIPIAERTGLIRPLSDWVIDQACQQTAAWAAQGLDLYVSINLPASFWRPTMIRHVLDTIESFGLNPNRMMVEITESAMLSNERVTAPILDELHSRGLQVAVDDFGTGHSSLSRLTQMHVTTLKIDRLHRRPARQRERRGARPLDHPTRSQPRPPAARRRHRDREPGRVPHRPRMQPRPGIPVQPGSPRRRVYAALPLAQPQRSLTTDSVGPVSVGSRRLAASSGRGTDDRLSAFRCYEEHLRDARSPPLARHSPATHDPY